MTKVCTFDSSVISRTPLHLISKHLDLLSGVMSALLTLPTFYNQFPQTDTTTTTGAQNSHNSVIQGLVVGIYEIGCLFGALWYARLLLHLLSHQA